MYLETAQAWQGPGFEFGQSGYAPVMTKTSRAMKGIDMNGLSSDAFERVTHSVAPNVRRSLQDRKVRRGLTRSASALAELRERVGNGAPTEVLAHLARDRAAQARLGNAIRSMTETVDAARHAGRRRSRMRRLVGFGVLGLGAAAWMDQRKSAAKREPIWTHDEKDRASDEAARAGDPSPAS